ncbi:MAG TPA: thioredoxin family protein [Pyrinomonadaceae bacterium]|nr:thioredoxin family protein [Pyrinomonadaceae bacterium]
MKIHSRWLLPPVTLLIFFVFFVGAEFSATAENQPRRTGAGGNNAPRAAAAKKPTAVLVKNDGCADCQPFYETMEALKKKYERSIEFKEVNAADPELAKKLNEFGRGYGTRVNFDNGGDPSPALILLSEGAPPDIKTQAQTITREEYDALFNSAANIAAARDAATQVVTQRNDGARLTNVEKDVAGLRARLDDLDQSKLPMAITNSQSLMDSWWAFPLVGFLLLTSIGLGVANFLLIKDGQTRLRQDLSRVAQKANAAATAAATSSTVPPPQRQAASASDGELTRLAQQLQQQQQTLQKQLTQVQTQLDGSEKRTAASIQAAIEQLSNWIARTQLRGAQLNGDDGDMQTTAALLTQYQEPLHQNAARVEPLTTVVGDLAHHLQTRSTVAPGLISRVQKLYQEIGQFEQWAQTVDAQLEALRRGSTDERQTRVQTGLRTLKGQLQAEQATLADYVRGYSRLLEENFPVGVRAAEAAPAVDPEQLKRFVEGTPDFLMDWFSDFSQLQSQVWAAQATDASIDSETLDAFARIQRTARDVLNSFDIQPEEIQVGQTLYDRNLHDFSMPRQGTPYPPQTIVEVQRAGFRRLSSGEVLRRPQVVVASSGVA